MDLATFYATVSAFGFTLLGLWWVVADRHSEWFEVAATRRMAYVVSLHFMIPSAMSLLSLVAPDRPGVWRAVFTVLGLSGLAGTASIASVLGSRRTLTRGAVAIAVPVYVAVVLVALVPDVSDVLDLRPLQLEAFLLCAVLLLGLHAAWFFAHEESPGKAAAD